MSSKSKESIEEQYDDEVIDVNPEDLDIKTIALKHLQK